MTNAEKIKCFSDTQLSNFLWIWTINSVTSFLEHGGMKLMNAKDMREWLSADESTFVRTDTFVSEDLAFDQSFNWKKAENYSDGCEDAVSRKAVRKILSDEFDGWPTEEEVVQWERLTRRVNELPSVTPEPKRIIKDDYEKE